MFLKRSGSEKCPGTVSLRHASLSADAIGCSVPALHPPGVFSCSLVLHRCFISKAHPYISLRCVRVDCLRLSRNLPNCIAAGKSHYLNYAPNSSHSNGRLLRRCTEPHRPFSFNAGDFALHPKKMVDSSYKAFPP